MRWIIGCVISAISGSAFADCTSNHVHLTGPWGSAQFSVEVVDTPQTRGQGLMFRTDLPRSAGMLFVFERAEPVAFWMRNTPLPLDMLFFTEQGELDTLHENAVPFDETPIPAAGDIKFVLEINGGMSALLGIGVPTRLSHSALKNCDNS